ncbi:kinase-like domain-containing protein [Mycena albidolilacea]|uniref:Kinase-like domain-containing protein n=1 Tax=Mycena albidolilacea TaxID=1033008 RepID=A0AAD7EAF2_9AGAR|nr:kinase-like domain-containing protein [Mycena albidolilacea]
MMAIRHPKHTLYSSFYKQLVISLILHTPMEQLFFEQCRVLQRMNLSTPRALFCRSEVTKPLVPTTPTIIPVYSTLLSFLADYTSNEISDLRTVLDDSLLSVAPESAFTAVTESLKRRETLLELASKHGLINLPNLQAALQTDDEWIAPLFVSIFDSKSAEEAVLCLQDGPAQNFLDVVQNALDKGYFLAKHSQTARRIIWKLSELSDKLPSSLFITGVSDVEKHAGSFGDIFRASYQNKLVALKRMRHSLEVDSHLVHSKFCREALIWNMLRHPHILPLLGIDRDILSSSNSLCMVSPWMKHGTVMKYLQDYGRTTVDKLLYEIALGLEYLHSVNIVHGDLRGSNILVDDGRCACLVGFALSEIIGDNDVDDNRSGNARWMAPELISPDHFGGQFARTPASDVYAFGCVCLELYTGRPPFSELSEAAALIKIFTGERPERPSGHSSMSDILWQHVTQFWAQEPSTRPETRLVVENMRRINTDNDQEQGIIIRPKKKGKEKEMAAEFSPAYDEDN